MNTTSQNLYGSNIRDRIKNTEAFEKFSKLQKKMFMSSSNVRSVNHALNVINNIGFKEWFRISNYSAKSVEVIQKLTNN